MKELTKKEKLELRGGLVWYAAMGLAICGMAVYEHGKHFIAGAFNPFESNE